MKTKHEAIEKAIKEWHTGPVKEMSLPQYLFEKGVEWQRKQPYVYTASPDLIEALGGFEEATTLKDDNVCKCPSCERGELS